MVKKLVYYIEPFIVAIVRPMLEERDRLIHPELAVKMEEVFEKLCTLRTLDSLESLEVLDSWLYCDWEEMLILLANSNVDFLNKQLKSFVASTDPAIQELNSRVVETRSKYLSPLVNVILYSLNKDETESHQDPSEHRLVVLTSKYRCWIHSKDEQDLELVVGLSPEQFTEGDEEYLSTPFKRIQLGFPHL